MTPLRQTSLAAALLVALASGSTALAPTWARASCGTPAIDGFENQRSRSVGTPWVGEGQAGIDVGLKLSLAGRNNAFARNTTGWNGLRKPVQLEAGRLYNLEAFIRSSANVNAGYFGFRDDAQHVLSETRFGPLASYQKLHVAFRPAQTGYYYIFAGFHAPNQDAWIQVDNVVVGTTDCPG